MGRHIGGVLAHAPELVDPEEGVILPNPFLLEEHRETILHQNQQGYAHEQRGYEDEDEECYQSAHVRQAKVKPQISRLPITGCGDQLNVSRAFLSQKVSVLLIFNNLSELNGEPGK